MPKLSYPPLVPEDDPLMIRYLRKKRKNIQALIESGLHYSTKPSEERVQKDIQIMRESLLKIPEESDLYNLDKTFLRRHAPSCVSGIVDYQNYIGEK